MKVRESDLKQALNPLPTSRNPCASHSLDPSVQTAKGSASSPLGATSARRKPLFKIPPWSLFKPLSAQTPTNLAKTNNDAIHNSSKHALRGPNEPAGRPPVVPSRCVSRGSSEREPIDGSVGGGRHVGRRNSQENPIVIDDDDDDDGDPTDRCNRTSHLTTVQNPGAGGESTDGDAGGATHMGEGVANSDLDSTAMLQCDDRQAIAASTSFSPEIPESYR